MWRAQEIGGVLTVVREDRVGRNSGVPVMPPGVPPGNHVRTGEALKAAKREAYPKIRVPLRVVGDYYVDRPQV